MITVIRDFDNFCRTPLQAVQKNNTPVTALNSRFASINCQLYEVWILLGCKQRMSNSFGELLLSHYKGAGSELIHAAALNSKFVSGFANGKLTAFEAHFHFSLLPTTDHGLVVSVVFGNERDMNTMYLEGLRELPNQEIDLEPST